MNPTPEQIDSLVSELTMIGITVPPRDTAFVHAAVRKWLASIAIPQMGLMQLVVPADAIDPPPKPAVKEGCCELCGEPMPPGEGMFKFHGYSGPCPKPATV